MPLTIDIPGYKLRNKDLPFYTCTFGQAHAERNGRGLGQDLGEGLWNLVSGCFLRKSLGSASASGLDRTTLLQILEPSVWTSYHVRML